MKDKPAWPSFCEDIRKQQESGKFSKSSLNALLYGEFEQDYRYEELCKNLAEYYKDTPDSVDNKAAMERWRLFQSWCFDNGYTYREINKAKMDRRFMDI